MASNSTKTTTGTMTSSLVQGWLRSLASMPLQQSQRLFRDLTTGAQHLGIATTPMMAQPAQPAARTTAASPARGLGKSGAKPAAGATAARPRTTATPIGTAPGTQETRARAA